LLHGQDRKIVLAISLSKGILGYIPIGAIPIRQE
jgi:hypothetical protein